MLLCVLIVKPFSDVRGRPCHPRDKLALRGRPCPLKGTSPQKKSASPGDEFVPGVRLCP